MSAYTPRQCSHRRRNVGLTPPLFSPAPPNRREGMPALGEAQQPWAPCAGAIWRGGENNAFGLMRTNTKDGFAAKTVFGICSPDVRSG